MSKPFDVATKQLVAADPLAWLRFLGLPGESAELIDADLSAVVAEADSGDELQDVHQVAGTRI